AVTGTVRFMWALCEIGYHGHGVDLAAMVVTGVLERGGAADYTVPGNPVHFLADRPHEVTATARGDVVREPVRVQVAQQLDHRRIRALQVPAARVGCCAVRKNASDFASKSSTLIPS